MSSHRTTCFLCGKTFDQPPDRVARIDKTDYPIHSGCEAVARRMEEVFHADLLAVTKPDPLTCNHDYQMLAEGYLPPQDMPPARLPNGVKLERIYWREDVCRKCGHAVRVA